MSKYLLFLICFGFFGLLRSQEITDEFIDSLFHSENEKYWYCLRSVYSLNYYINHVGKPDTIAYRREGDGILFSYQGDRVKGIFDWGNTAPRVSVSGGGSMHSIQWNQGIFRKPNGLEMRIRVRNSVFHHLDEEVVFAYYRDEVLTGNYMSLTIDKVVIKEGNYLQIDSSFVDTILTVDPETYEVHNDYVLRKKYPKKVGTWVYRNPSGDTLKVEHYPEKYD